MAKPNPKHRCNCPGCATQVDLGRFCCRHHWSMLPPPMRATINATYQPGLTGHSPDATIDYRRAYAAAQKHWFNMRRVMGHDAPTGKQYAVHIA